MQSILDRVFQKFRLSYWKILYESSQKFYKLNFCVEILLGIMIIMGLVEQRSGFVREPLMLRKIIRGRLKA